MTFKHGQRVTYRSSTAGGYGYKGRDIPAEFLRYTYKRAVIRLWLADGSDWRDIAVHPYNLTRRIDSGTVEASKHSDGTRRSEAP